MISTKKFSTKLLKAIATLMLGIMPTSCSWFAPPEHSYAQKAETATIKGNTTEAIRYYRKHIDARLAVPNRADWENPYFYLLLIGDLYLQQNETQLAVTTYQEALDHGVEQLLVADRICLASNKIERSGDLKAAYELLLKYRKLNPNLFDITLNRVARALTDTESP